MRTLATWSVPHSSWVFRATTAGQTHWPAVCSCPKGINSCAASQEIPLISRTAWPLKMGQIGYPETSVTTNQRCVKYQKNKYLTLKVDDSVLQSPSLLCLLSQISPNFSLLFCVLNIHFNGTINVRRCFQDFPFFHVLLPHHYIHSPSPLYITLFPPIPPSRPRLSYNKFLEGYVYHNLITWNVL